MYSAQPLEATTPTPQTSHLLVAVPLFIVLLLLDKLSFFVQHQPSLFFWTPNHSPRAAELSVVVFWPGD